MSPSKLDAAAKARDYRRDDRRRKKRKRRHETEPLPNHVDVTSIVFASQQPDIESRFIVLDALPDMDEEWIDTIVYLRQTQSGAPDRAFLGIQNLDDSLVWIELSLTTTAPAETPGAPFATWVRHIGGSELSGLILPSVNGIDVGSDGSLWVSDFNLSRIHKYNASTGAFVATVTSNLGLPFGIAGHSSNDRIYVVDGTTITANSARVEIYVSSTGVHSGNLSNASTDDNRLHGIAFTPGELYVHITDNTADKVWRVRVSDGVAMDSFTTTGMSLPCGLDIDSTGKIYVGHGTGNNVVFKFSSVGVLLDTWGNADGAAGVQAGQFNQPRDIYIDGSDRVFVCDTLNSRVQVFATDGTFLGQFGELGSGNGQLENPCGIGGSGSSVYVVDNGNKRISEWTVP